MFQGWRIKLREAEDAVDRGQLDEAAEILQDSELGQFLPGKRLAGNVAEQFASRSRRTALRGDAEAAWRDLESARRLVGESETVHTARTELVAIAMAEVTECLEKGETPVAIQKLTALERRGIRDEMMRQAREAARHLESARHLAQKGKFNEALEQLKQSSRLLPDLALIPERQADCRRRGEQCRVLIEQLHRAMLDEDNSQMLTLADQVLELAPENQVALEARQRAWAKVGANYPESRVLQATQMWTPSQIAASGQVTVEEADLGTRFLLWVDGVGGYLVCLSDEIELGQADPHNAIHIPLQADVSRRHARICRRGEGYVVEPQQRTAINGQLISETTLLTDGDELLLGEGGVQLRFRQPHALSASARIELVSRHRTRPAVDAIILMAESCVLGPNLQNHVVCRDWENDVVLYRRNNALYCRAMDSIEIDGRLCDGRGPVSFQSRVSGDDFSMSLEEVK